MYDVQINNARDMPVTVAAHRWETADAAGKQRREEGAGVGGNYEAKEVTLPAGEAFRTRGIVTTSTPTGNAWGPIGTTISTIGTAWGVGITQVNRLNKAAAELRPKPEPELLEKGAREALARAQVAHDAAQNDFGKHRKYS